MVIDNSFGDVSAPKLRVVEDSSTSVSGVKRVKILPVALGHFSSHDEAQKVCELYSSAGDSPRNPLHYLAIRNDIANFSNQSLEGLCWYYSVVPEDVGFVVLVVFGRPQNMVAAGLIEDAAPMECSD